MYILAELDELVHKQPFTAFPLVSYYPCSCTIILLSLSQPMLDQGSSILESQGDVREQGSVRG